MAPTGLFKVTAFWSDLEWLAAAAELVAVCEWLSRKEKQTSVASAFHQWFVSWTWTTGADRQTESWLTGFGSRRSSDHMFQFNMRLHLLIYDLWHLTRPERQGGKDCWFVCCSQTFPADVFSDGAVMLAGHVEVWFTGHLKGSSCQ